MKKVFLVATAALLFTGISFAHSGDGKKCGKGEKECCKKGAKDGKDAKDCCKKEVKKDDKKTAKTTAKA